MSFFDPNDPDTWGGSGSSNTAPTVTSGSSANFAENGTGTVYTAQASDGQGHTITWSLSGIDAGRFNIVSSTGVVTFKVGRISRCRPTTVSTMSTTHRHRHR
jgi:hypothetical protein